MEGEASVCASYPAQSVLNWRSFPGGEHAGQEGRERAAERKGKGTGERGRRGDHAYKEFGTPCVLSKCLFYSLPQGRGDE